MVFSNGISDNASAAEAPVIARTSVSFSNRPKALRDDLRLKRQPDGTAA
jgi:hypothetical protein